MLITSRCLGSTRDAIVDSAKGLSLGVRGRVKTCFPGAEGYRIPPIPANAPAMKSSDFQEIRQLLVVLLGRFLLDPVAAILDEMQIEGPVYAVLDRMGKLLGECPVCVPTHTPYGTLDAVAFQSGVEFLRGIIRNPKQIPSIGSS